MRHGGITVLATAGMMVALAGGPAPAASVYVIDGDTVRVGSRTIRLIGIDTPERGRCGFHKARSKMIRLVRSGVRVRNVSGKDRYGRTLAYLRRAGGRDVGAAMIRSGWAVARYDGLDGYAKHPKQWLYRRLDARHSRGSCVP